MPLAKTKTTIEKTLNSLSLEERLTVVAMIAAVLHHRMEAETLGEGPDLIIGTEVEDLEVLGLEKSKIRILCEQLVEKGIFARQLGDDDIACDRNAPLSADNWYSFHSYFVSELDKKSLYLTVGLWVSYLIKELPVERKQLFFVEATRAIFQSTYL